MNPTALETRKENEMRKSFLAVGAASLCVLAVSGAAFAQSQLTVHGNGRMGIPLPHNLTSSDDWLDSGNVVAVGSENNYATQIEGSPDIQVGPDLDENF